MTAYRTAGERDLGPVVARHFPRRGAAREWLVMLALLLAAPIAGVGAWVTGDIGGTDRIALTVVAGILTPVLGFVFSRALRHRREEVVIHERGCVARADGGETAFAWEDVVACRTEPVRLEPEVRRDCRFALVLRNGTRLSVPNDPGVVDPITAVADFAPALRAELGRALLRDARQAAARGEAIRFGDLEVHGTRGLSSGPQVLSWDDLTGVDLDDDGRLTIVRRPKEAWRVVDPATIDNLDLLLDLLQSRTALLDEALDSRV